MSKAGELKKPLLVIKTTEILSSQTSNLIKEALEPVVERIGADFIIVEKGLDAELNQDSKIAQAIEANTAAVLKVIEINSALIQTLAEMEQEEMEDVEPENYMDGSRI